MEPGGGKRRIARLRVDNILNEQYKNDLEDDPGWGRIFGSTLVGQFGW